MLCERPATIASGYEARSIGVGQGHALPEDDPRQ
jgi:hypothetical protein